MRLNKFLVCLKLELGGMFLGCISLIASVILIYLTIINYNNKALKLTGLLCAAFVYALFSVFLIQGTRRRNHIMTQPFRILCYLAFIAIIFAIVLIITKLKSKDSRSFYFHHLLMAILGLIAEFYVLLVVDSLHKKFRDEKFQHGGFTMSRY